LVGTDGSDLSLTDKLKSLTGMWLWCRNQRHVRHEESGCGQGRHRKTVQWFLFWSPETSTWVHFIEKIFSMLHKMFIQRAYSQISIISRITKNDRCKAAEVRGLMDIEHSWRYATLLKLIWPPWKRSQLNLDLLSKT
jgi:hypothetical protein